MAKSIFLKTRTYVTFDTEFKQTNLRALGTSCQRDLYHSRNEMHPHQEMTVSELNGDRLIPIAFVMLQQFHQNITDDFSMVSLDLMERVTLVALTKR